MGPGATGIEPGPFTLNRYQELTAQFVVYDNSFGVLDDPHLGLYYCTLGLCGESGEIANKVKKIIRDSSFCRDDLVDELGDCLWYVARTASELGVSLGEVARRNIDKLSSRQQQDKLHGSGDNR